MNIDKVKYIRKKTGYPICECVKALKKRNWQVELAIKDLHKKNSIPSWMKKKINSANSNQYTQAS